MSILKSKLLEMIEVMTDAEINMAILAVETYRKKRVTVGGPKIGAYDSFLAGIGDQDFTAKDVIASGTSVTAAYARIAQSLEKGEIEVVGAGVPGMGKQPTKYRKIFL